MITLHPLTRANWEQAVHLQVATDQADLLPDNLTSIAQSRFEQNCELYGIYKNDLMVGFAMVCRYANVHWITRFMIDHHQQGNGYGTRALEILLKRLYDIPGAKEVRTTLARKNALAEHLFTSHGFRRMNDLDDLELVMRKVF